MWNLDDVKDYDQTLRRKFFDASCGIGVPEDIGREVMGGSTTMTTEQIRSYVFPSMDLNKDNSVSYEEFVHHREHVFMRGVSDGLEDQPVTPTTESPNGGPSNRTENVCPDLVCVLFSLFTCSYLCLCQFI